MVHEISDQTVLWFNVQRDADFDGGPESILWEARAGGEGGGIWAKSQALWKNDKNGGGGGGSLEQERVARKQSQKWDGCANQPDFH